MQSLLVGNLLGRKILGLLTVSALALTVPDFASAQEQSRQTLASPTAGLLFGNSVSLDGSTALVGSTGGASTFVRNAAGTYVPDQVLPKPAGLPNFPIVGNFGSVVAISGENAAATAVFQPLNFEFGQGVQEQVIVYRRVGQGASASYQVRANVARSSSPGLGPIGNGLAINNQYVFTRTAGLFGQGAVLVYNLDGAFVTQLVAPSGGGVRFGESLAVQGNLLVVGADNANFIGNGNAFVYRFNNAGQFKLVAQLNSPLQQQRDTTFGASVAISGDSILVSSEVDGGVGFVFKRKPGQNTFALDQTLRTVRNDVGSFHKVTVALDGDRAAIGVEGTSIPGQVYLFKRNQSGSLLASGIAQRSGPAVETADFGQALSLQNDQLIIGNSFANNNRGAAFALTLF